MISRHIADLLYYHECVIVPGMGGFIKANSPSRIVSSTHQFFPPSGNIAFNAGLSGNDGILANHISSIENTTYREALYEVRQWVEKCFTSMQKGEKILLEGIGSISLNSDGNIEFTPSLQVNFNADSYGLPVFFARTVQEATFANTDAKPVINAVQNPRLRRLIPETLKWAAVLAPFVGFVLWGSLNGNLIDSYVHNYTGMYSWVRSTPGKTAPIVTSSAKSNQKPTSAVAFQSPEARLTDPEIEFYPGQVSYAEMQKSNVVIAESGQVQPAGMEQTQQDFYIVGGAFRDHNNALKLIGILQSKGYPASIVDTTSGGLYIVSMKGFNSYAEAIIQLDQVKLEGFTTSWILKKNRG